MQKKNIYMCTMDLKQLRKGNGWSVADLSERTYISSRTINRIESANGTRNEAMAMQISRAFSRPFEQLFTKADESMLEALRDYVPPLMDTSPVPDTCYYQLYVRRVSDIDANIWGRTEWVGQYDPDHELRVLSKLSEAGVNWFYRRGNPVITTEDDWKSFLFHTQIGRTQSVLVSEQAARGWMLAYILEEYIVAPYALMEVGLPDVILLGDYPNRSSVRSRRAVERPCRRRARRRA